MTSYQSIALFICITFSIVNASYQNIPTYTQAGLTWTSYKECKSWANDVMDQFEQQACGSLTGSAYKDCIQYTYKPQSFALRYACKSYKPMWDLYVSRQSPVNILGAWNTDFNGGDLQGRSEVEATSFFDLSALATNQTFELVSYCGNKSKKGNCKVPKYKYIPTTPNVSRIKRNNATYDLSELRLKTPAEHLFDGKQVDFEIQLFFNIVAGIDQQIRGDTQIALSYLAVDYSRYNGTSFDLCTSSSSPFDDFFALQQTATLSLGPELVSRFYGYSGSDTDAPYAADVTWYISPYLFDTAVSSFPTGSNYPQRPNARAIGSEALLYLTTPTVGCIA